MKRGRRRAPGRVPKYRQKRDDVFRARVSRDFPAQDAPVGPCPDCGKMAYHGRAEARRNARRLYPDQAARVYRCGRWWHYSASDAETTERLRDHYAAQDTTCEEEDGER